MSDTPQKPVSGKSTASVQQAASALRAHQQATGAVRVDHLRAILGDPKMRVGVKVAGSRAASSVLVTDEI